MKVLKLYFSMIIIITITHKLVTISFSKTAYLCKTVCYDLFLKNNLFKTTYLIKKPTYYNLFSKKKLNQNSLSYENNLLRSLLKKSLFKTAYLCKTTYYDLFFKNNLLKTAYLCKTACYNLFLKNS